MHTYGREKCIQDTPDYIINAQGVIIIQVQGNEKPELDIKTAKFPDKEEIIFHACLTSSSSRPREHGIYHRRNKWTPCSLILFGCSVEAGDTAHSQRQNRFTKLTETSLNQL